MGYFRRLAVTVTTDALGAGVGYTEEPVNGYIHEIVYDKTDFADGSTMTVTGDSTGTAIWTESAVNADAVRLPRTQVCGPTGTALTYDGTRIVAEPVALADERVKIVVASGGDKKTGVFYVVVGA